MIKTKKSTLSWGAVLTLALGIGASFVLSLIVYRVNERQAEDSVVATTEQVAGLVLERLKLYQYGLRGTRGAVITAGEHGISRELFKKYQNTRNLTSEFPGARAMGFIRRVPQHDEIEFLKSARADGAADFSIRQLAAHTGERYIIQYVEPVEENRAAIGLDIASETARREAAESSMESGMARLTGPITLVQAIGKPQQSFLLMMPIYRDGITPVTQAEREKAAFGWSYAVLQTEQVLNSLGIENSAVHLRLRDVTVPGQEQLFYESTSSASDASLMSHQVEREVFGRQWKIELAVNSLYLDRLNQVSPAFVLLLGFLLTFLVATLIGVMSVSRERRRQVISEQARLATILESSAEAIIGKTLDGVVTTWNKAAERLFIYTSEEAIGQSLANMIVPPELKTEEIDLLARIRLGERVENFDTKRFDKNRCLVDVSISVSPIYGEDGRIVGASKAVRDISAKKQAEARILELNSSLEEQVAQRTHELRSLNVLLGSVLRSATEVSIIATDMDGVIRVFNDGAEQMLGYTADDLIGKCTPIVFHDTDEVDARGVELSQEYSQTVDGFYVFTQKPNNEGAETREWTYIRKDGSSFPVTLVVTSMRDDDGKLSGYLGIAVDITERKAAERELAASLETTERQRSELMAMHEQLVLAADVAELGIWSWTLADNALQWNDRMFELYGQPMSLRNSGLNYSHWYSRVHPDDVVDTSARLNAAVDGAGTYDTVFRVVRPDGQIRFIQAGAQIERDSSGTALCVTGINRDITSQRELESRLLYAKEQADLASAAKSAFLANMSHEIRTPMNAVLGMLQLVQNTELNGRQLDYVTKAQTAAKSLLSLLNDILDYSKIEVGKLQLDLHPFQLETLMCDLAVVLAGNQGQKEVEVIFDIDSNLPNDLIGDSLRLQQVLINLAGNALKFTSEGQVVVSIHQILDTEENITVRIAVSDTGIGINSQQLLRIFEGFTQAEASTSRRFGGTGLGLVICKRLVSLMGGDLQVESQEGVGSRFWFDITLDIADKSLLRSFCPGVDEHIRVLVVDDNAMASELLVRTVRALGWKADEVSGGAQAVESVLCAQASGEPYNVVLMDWRMPVVDGLSAAQMIQQSSNSLPPPMIIMITAYGREVLADANKDGNAPFVGFLTKPITPKQLADAVNQAFSGGSSFPTAYKTPNLDRPKRLSGLRLLVVEDNEFNRQVADELLTSEGAHVTLAEGGLEGVKKVVEERVSFDVVLMDIQMPDIDGLEATRRIRSHDEFLELPILAMTANASISDREECIAAGMNEHVGKPIDLEHLVATLLSQVSGRFEPILQSPNKIGEGRDIVENKNTIINRFGGNLDLIKKVLSSFGPELEKQLVRLRHDILRHDTLNAALVLHTIKGSSGSMGATSLSEYAGSLEQKIKHGDEISKANLLSDMTWVSELEVLLTKSIQKMNLDFGFTYPSSVTSNVEKMELTQWKDCLKEILILLKAGNLDALDLAADVAPKTPDLLRERFNDFCLKVESLDFRAAIPMGQDLLESF